MAYDWKSFHDFLLSVSIVSFLGHMCKALGKILHAYLFCIGFLADVKKHIFFCDGIAIGFVRFDGFQHRVEQINTKIKKSEVFFMDFPIVTYNLWLPIIFLKYIPNACSFLNDIITYQCYRAKRAVAFKIFQPFFQRQISSSTKIL